MMKKLLIAAALLASQHVAQAQVIIGGGGTGTSGGISNVATGNGLCGGPITTTGTITTCLTQRAVTLATDALLSTDGGKVVTYSNASSIAVSLVQANTAGFTSGYAPTLAAIGAGTVTVTAATSTFGNGLTTLILSPGQIADIGSDSVNYPMTALSLPVMAQDTILGTFGAKNYPVAQAVPACANDGAHALVYASHALACAAVTGTATPGGSSGQIQYNNSGALGGFTASGDLTVNTATGAVTLATVNANVGTFGDATHCANFTVNAKGLITAAAQSTSCPGAGGSATPFVNYVPNNFYLAMPGTGATTVTGSATSTRWTPIYISEPVTISQLCASVINTGGNFALGIYANDNTTTNHPTGSVLASTGSVSGGSAVVVCANVSFSFTSAGTWWIAEQVDNATVTFKGISTTNQEVGYRAGAATASNLAASTNALIFSTATTTFLTWPAGSTAVESSSSSVFAPNPIFKVASVP